MANPAFWRRWHRWIGFPAALFLLFASITGVLVAATEFFGEAEALREATRDLVSPVQVGQPDASWSEPMARAFASAARVAGNAPVDKVLVQFKGEQPTVEIFTGRPGGGEDQRFIFDAHTGRLLGQESYADKPFIHRLHSGEAFGDGGLVLAMFWGLSLAGLSGSGLVIYFTMRRKNPQGLQKVFW